MQTAQRIIKGYRRRRFIVCAAMAVLVLFLTLSVRYIAERNLNEQRVQGFNERAIITIENILAPLDEVSADVTRLVGMPCEAALLRMREHVARMQTLRSITLIKDGVLYCSSIFGSRNVPVSQLQPRLPDSSPLLLLSTDSSLLKGSPILVSWHPLADGSQNGVMEIVNIEMLTGLMSEPERPWVSRAVLNVAGSHLEYGKGLLAQVSVNKGLVSHEMASEKFPFSIISIGPSAGDLALKNLPTQFPLALILSMLIGYITWLATANRMSFSWEINLGLASREFEVFCQPLLNARNQQCVGVELLLRWNNPRQGWISPEVFIPLAEQQNLIAPLTRFVLDEAVRHLDMFPKSRDFHIGVNVAASHFHNGEIIGDLKRYWFPSNAIQPLMLELTERDALPDVDHRVVRALHRLGVSLAIDDFGTGQSSLAYLETLSPDVLKIDKSFTAAIGTDAVNSTVTDIIIALAQRLGIDLVAEGVETPEQAEYLRNHGVDILQGYLFARPMPLKEFPRWLEGRSPPPPHHNGHAVPVIPLH
ncbi:EAL domain-containing protein [Enterobacteriaceae bacterium H20N1]|uniref:cyclic-guanylate-specific phosphodiesterase n=1 Tax=Dryocola boscaweniae TaxID=2925397 RepID=A0A9X2W8W5_9ENTR|nr:cyclic diguanylate phosphodiesterase [Dryocola boscaweniae]MCT4702313.1 EAL domain-containing protein [Dryocola boscaweniae]MCT4719243.1 EAL domain-containing protein [Dryocola boscaweniae]